MHHCVAGDHRVAHQARSGAEDAATAAVGGARAARRVAGDHAALHDAGTLQVDAAAVDGQSVGDGESVDHAVHDAPATVRLPAVHNRRRGAVAAAHGDRPVQHEFGVAAIDAGIDQHNLCGVARDVDRVLNVRGGGIPAQVGWFGCCPLRHQHIRKLIGADVHAAGKDARAAVQIDRPVHPGCARAGVEAGRTLLQPVVAARPVGEARHLGDAGSADGRVRAAREPGAHAIVVGR